MEKELKIVQSVTISLIPTIIFITTITIAADLFLPLKNWLKLTFTHHWIGKSILSLALFLGILIFLLIFPKKSDSKKILFWLQILLVTTVLGFLAIFGFFVYEGFLVS